MDKPIKLGFTSIMVGDSPVESSLDPILKYPPPVTDSEIIAHIDRRFDQLEAQILTIHIRMCDEFRIMRESRLSFRIWRWIKGLFNAI